MKVKGSYPPKQLVNGQQISGQEYKVFRLIGQGLNTAEIANRLSIRNRAVDGIKQTIKKKLGLHHHTKLTSYATRELVKQEIKDGDFCRDDLLAVWIHHQLATDIKATALLDTILAFRLLTPTEVGEQLRRPKW